MELTQLVKEALLKLYNETTGLFYRHGRTGPTQCVSRRIACFANQVYPLMALAIHSPRSGCERSARIAKNLADLLCEHQGPLGQWWWLYDAAEGNVVDGYPVFSVHQDGMAPMALLEVATALSVSYEEQIDKSLKWIYGENELRSSLVLPEQGLVLRDIHRQGVGRIRRMIQGGLWVCGWRGEPKPAVESTSFVMNQECRPYHLGWLLYAAGMMQSLYGKEKPVT
jgi:hypothetical protein